MDWTEVTLYTNKEALEPLEARLMDIGCGSVVVEDPEELKEFIAENENNWDMVDESVSEALKNARLNIKVYVSQSEDGKALLMRITELIDGLKAENAELYGDLSAESLFVKDEDWAYNWREFFSAFAVGKKLYIKPVWDETASPKDRITVTVDPGSSFGSGQHETTKLALTELETYAPGAEHVMDIGCGSGILTVAASKLGAKRVTATDIDENAVAATKESLELNGIKSGVSVKKTDLAEGIDEKADVVVANIFAGTIIRFTETIKNVLKTGGVFISTGIIADRLEDVKAAYLENGFEIVNTPNIGEWYLISGMLK